MSPASSTAGASILVVNGPNLNFLGRREPALYGSVTLAHVNESLTVEAGRHGVTIDFRQSNSEGVLIDAVQEAMTAFDAVIINPGGLSHTSVALRDALAMISVPIIEVHVTNIHAREAFRHHSFISGVAKTVIVGAGTNGYLLALAHAMELLSTRLPHPVEAASARAGDGQPASVLVLNGPNLNFLGTREPDIYGHVTLAEVREQVIAESGRLGVAADFRHSNSEGILIDAAQEAMTDFAAVIINPAGLSFTSVALRDSLSMLPVPVIELHLTNIMAREEYLHHSYISPIATSVIMGAGTHGYALALRQVAHLVAPAT
jgi:3-dehydroquinate dehydratase-2